MTHSTNTNYTHTHGDTKDWTTRAVMIHFTHTHTHGDTKPWTTRGVTLQFHHDLKTTLFQSAFSSLQCPVVWLTVTFNTVRPLQWTCSWSVTLNFTLILYYLPTSSILVCQYFQYTISCLQCFDAVGWVAGRVSGLWKTEWWGAGMVICLERGTDLHMVQLMPLPLAVSCISKIQISFTFLVPAHPGSAGQRATKWACVCTSTQKCPCKMFKMT